MGFITNGIAAIASMPAIRDQGITQQALDHLNAQNAQAQSADALQRGGYAASQARTAGTQMVGQQKVGYAASGVSADSGSALDTMADTRMMSERDAQQLKNNAAREALGYQTKAYEYRLGGKLDELRTSNQAMAIATGSAASSADAATKFIGS